MRKILGMVAVLLLLALAMPALADVSKLKPGKGVRKVDLRPYTHIVVANFTDEVKKRPDDQDEKAAFDKVLVTVGENFARSLSERLAESKAFESVERQRDGATAVPNTFVITGRITDYRDSNLGLRYIGLGAGTRFAADMELRDAATGQVIATAKGSFKGSLIPGAVNFVESVERFMDGVALRFANEILISKGALFREETGRSGRLRDKYKSS